MRASSQSAGAARRKPREKGPSFASAVATGAVLAALVAGGGVLLNSAGTDDGQVTQLETGGSGPEDELVEQIPLADGGAPGAVVPQPGGFVIPDSLNIPDLQIPDLTAGLAGSGTPLAPSGPATAGSPTGPSTGTSTGNGSAPTAAACPTFEAPATIAVNTVYPGGAATDSVPTGTGTLRATRAAFGPCTAKTVELDVVKGRATGSLGYGAWLLTLEGASPVTQWPVVVVTSTSGVSAIANAAGTCPTAKTRVTVTATNRPLLGLLPTPLISGRVTATPVARSAPCQPTAAVPVQLDLLGRGFAELAPGTWTFTVVGRSLAAPVSVAAGEFGGAKSVALVAN